MKVCILCTYYDPCLVGGAEISARLLAENLAANGIEVHVLTPNYSSGQDEVEAGKVIIHRFKSISRSLDKKKEASHSIYNRSRAFSLLLLNQYVKYLSWKFRREFEKLNREHRFDIVHANNFENALALKHISAGIPKVAHIRDLTLFCLNKHTSGGVFCSHCTVPGLAKCLSTSRFMAFLIRWDIISRRTRNIGRIDHYIAISTFMKEGLLLEKIPKRRISVIFNPVGSEAVAKLSRADARKKLGLKYRRICIYVGALNSYKGAHIIPAVAKMLPEVDFIVVGDGPLRHLFDGPSGSSGNVHYLGKRPASEVSCLYRAADALLVPATAHQGFGRIIMEGQMNAIPVIATDVAGVREVIRDNETGILVPHNSPKAMAQAIRRLLADKTLQERIARRSEEFARGAYSEKAFASKVVALYNRLSGSGIGPD
ncbi:MAG: glycosyltransferase family 4 protein [archaeon]